MLPILSKGLASPTPCNKSCRMHLPLSQNPVRTPELGCRQPHSITIAALIPYKTGVYLQRRRARAGLNVANNIVADDGLAAAAVHKGSESVEVRGQLGNVAVGLVEAGTFGLPAQPQRAGETLGGFMTP